MPLLFCMKLFYLWTDFDEWYIILKGINWTVALKRFGEDLLPINWLRKERDFARSCDISPEFRKGRLVTNLFSIGLWFKQCFCRIVHVLQLANGTCCSSDNLIKVINYVLLEHGTHWPHIYKCAPLTMHDSEHNIEESTPTRRGGRY